MSQSIIGMPVLVIGGAGYLGSAITSILLAQGAKVTVYDNLLYQDYYQQQGVSFIYGDVRDRGLLHQTLPHFGVVIWLAAIVGDGACALYPDEAKAINYEAVSFLARSFDGRIIFPSTCSVYGRSENDNLLNEYTPFNPLSLYAETKVWAETALANCADCIIFRLGTLYGTSEVQARPRFDLVANTFAAAAITRGTINVYGGDQWRPMLSVNDAARVFAGEITGNGRGVYNLVGTNLVIAELASIVARICGGEIAYSDVMIDRRSYAVTGLRAQIDLNFRPLETVEAGVIAVRNLILSGRVPNPWNPRFNNQQFLKANSDRVAWPITPEGEKGWKG